MFCEPYKNALSRAVLGGEGLSREGAAHLGGCAACRAALADEQALAALVDGGVRRIANAETPASLVPRVRAQIAQAPAAPARGFRAFGLAAAALAMAGAVIWLSELPRNSVEETNPATRALTADRNNAPSQFPAGTVPHREKAAAAAKRLMPRVLPAHQEPLVLVSPEERAGLERYLGSLSRTRQSARPEAAALVSDAKGIEPLEITAMDLKAMTTEPLDSGGSK